MVWRLSAMYISLVRIHLYWVSLLTSSILAKIHLCSLKRGDQEGFNEVEGC